MHKNILLINDMPGYGKVALGAMIPILSAMGHYIHNLPTALVSNTLDYGKFEILETTEYMRRSIVVWNELGFTFDCLCTGFLVTEEQVDIIRAFADEEKNKNLLVISDPIMGDYGKLYNGVDESRIGIMRKLIARADIVIPNLTEACFLTGLHAGETEIAESDIKPLIEGVRALGPKSVVVTSIALKGKKERVVGVYDHKLDRTFCLPYAHVPVVVPGTGDIFSAVMTGKLLNGDPLVEAVRMAMGAVRFLIDHSLSSKDTFRGLLIEKFITSIEDISKITELNEDIREIRQG